MTAFVGQIRGSYVLNFQTYPTGVEIPTWQDVLANPPAGIQDGDTLVVIDAGDEYTPEVPPAIVAQGVYSHPSPVITAISGPQT